MSAIGVKQTSRGLAAKSASDPKQTWRLLLAGVASSPTQSEISFIPRQCLPEGPPSLQNDEGDP